MTVASLFSDMILIGVFMLAGFFVREIVKPIQKLFLPASLIGGLLALILGQQMLGLVEILEILQCPDRSDHGGSVIRRYDQQKESCRIHGLHLR